jgi:hypothetical protein
MNEKGSNYSIDDKNINIDNFLGLAELQKRYNIFSDFRIIEYIKYVKTNTINVTSDNYFKIIDDLRIRQESLFMDINLNEAINWQNIPQGWQGKELNIYLNQKILKNITIKNA